MNDEFLHRLRKQPRPEFAARLRTRLRQQSASPPSPRVPSRARTLLTLLLLGGTAFAFTLGVRGVPAPLLHLFHHAVTPVATQPTIMPAYRVASSPPPTAPAPAAGGGTPPAPPDAVASSPAPPVSAAPTAAEVGPWEYFLSGNYAPLLRGWIDPGLPPGWRVHGAVLSKSGLVEDLQSTQTYRDFELQLRWKIGQGGDSGIFYRATHDYPQIYWSGPEYQLLDDDSRVGIRRTWAAGAVFDLYPSPAGVEKPYGHWNATRIVVRGNDVRYWLNGHLIVSYTLGSDDWKLRVSESKFAPYAAYGRAPEGLIGLQGENSGSLEVRDMRIRELP